MPYARNVLRGGLSSVKAFRASNDLVVSIANGQSHIGQEKRALSLCSVNPRVISLFPTGAQGKSGRASAANQTAARTLRFSLSLVGALERRACRRSIVGSHPSECWSSL